MLTPADLDARKQRLEKLSFEIAKEVTLIDQHDDPLQNLERWAYRKALREVLDGVDTVRVAAALVWENRGNRSFEEVTLAGGVTAEVPRGVHLRKIGAQTPVSRLAWHPQIPNGANHSEAAARKLLRSFGKDIGSGLAV
jgi:hypothetical protein